MPAQTMVRPLALPERLTVRSTHDSAKAEVRDWLAHAAGQAGYDRGEMQALMVTVGYEPDAFDPYDFTLTFVEGDEPRAIPVHVL